MAACLHCDSTPLCGTLWCKAEGQGKHGHPQTFWHVSVGHFLLCRDWDSTHLTFIASILGKAKGKRDFWCGANQSIVSGIGRIFFHFYYCFSALTSLLNSKIIWSLLTNLTFFSFLNLWRSLADFSAIKSLYKIGSRCTQS